MITKAGIIYGLGDALNARAFLLTYCKQKGYATNNITIYTDRYWFLFEKEGFKRELDRQKMRGLIGYRNFCNYDMPKLYNIPKLDECIAKNAGIDFSFDTIVPLNWKTKIDLVLPKKFVTVNNGYGRLSGNPLDKNIICTKAWSLEYWNELVLKIGIPCVQVGNGDSCFPIKHTVLNLVNKLTLQQSAEVMKKALFHIDIEGGLVILNQHIGGKSVVLFGSTAIENQGRSFNLNLRSNYCEPCYEWGNNKYKLKMPKDALPCQARCMKELKPDYVIDQIYKNKWLT